MAKRRKRTPGGRGQRQIAGAPPIIEDAKLPRMGEAVPQSRSRAVMAENPGPAKGKGKRMRPVRKSDTAAGAGRPPAKGFRDQEPPRRSRSPKDTETNGGDGYLRLRVLVEPGKLSLAGGTVVDGPLTQPPVLHPGLAYEVTVSGRRLAVGQVQDAGVWRSFGDPTGRPALAGHHITVLPSYEIAVRIPLTDLSQAALRRANITLYRWRGDVAGTEGERSMKSRLGKRVETIGRLKGIRLDALPKGEHARLRATFRRK